MNIRQLCSYSLLSLALFSAPITALAADPANTPSSFQKFFGYYSTWRDIDGASNVSNAMIRGYSGYDPELIKSLTTARSHGSKVIIRLQDVFFPSGYTLSPNASATFSHLVSIISPYQSSVAGFYVFDEPYWNLQLSGNPVTNAQLETSLESVAKLIKTATPNIPSIIVFAKPEIDMPDFYTKLLPPDISAIGFDCYLDGCSTDVLKNELAIMDSSKYPSQKLILVPDANISQSHSVSDDIDARVAERVLWYQQQALNGPYARDILGILAFAYDGNYYPGSFSGWYGVDSLLQTKTALAGFYSAFANTAPITPTVVLARWQNSNGTRQRTTTGIAMDNGITTKGSVLGHLFTSQPNLPSIELEECLSTVAGPGYFNYTISVNGTCAPARYTRLRTLGWIYRDSQPGTVRLYRCWSPANRYHFGTLDPLCEGTGDTAPVTLGYILASASTPTATASITAGNTSLSVGQSTNISATFTPGVGDSLLNTDIDEVAAGTTSYVNKVFSGAQWGTAVRSSLNYQFTPTGPGAYKFYTFVQTSVYPSWTAVTPQSVTVNVFANIPPTLTIWTTSHSMTVGQSATITAYAAPASGDGITSTAINRTPPGGSESSVAMTGSGNGTYMLDPISYTFTPTAAGTYIFKPYALTRGFGTAWQGGNPVTISVSAAVPPAPTGLSATCTNHTATQTWNPSSGATSYKFHSKDVAAGVTFPDATLSSATNAISGLYASDYSWSVAACNSVGCSAPTAGADFSCYVATPPTGTITATQSSITVGQSTTLTASFTAGSGDMITSSAINQVIPGGEYSVVRTGADNGTTLKNPVSYAFTPTAPGTYVFKAYAQTKSYGTAWQQPASVTLLVTQKALSLPTSRTEFYSSLSQCLLARQATAGEVASWTSRPSSMTLSSIYQQWFSSPEYMGKSTSNETFVTQLYNCISWRQPDIGGYNAYVAALQGGQPRAELVDTFLNANEFLTNYGPKLHSATGYALYPAGVPTSRIAYFSDLYACIDNRVPDATGLASWMRAASSTSLAYLYQAWFTSPEYLGKNTSNQTFVTELYNCILYRRPDDQGSHNYMNELQHGLTRISAIQSFTGSSEFLGTQGPKLHTATGFTLSGSAMQADNSSQLASLIVSLQAILKLLMGAGSH